MDMSNDQLLQEIREANLTYLMLAQRMIRADRADAIVRLGISEHAADLIAQMTPGQILKIASGSMLLLRFRVEDDLVWELLTNQPKGRVNDESANRLHASILMAGQFSEAVGDGTTTL